MDHDNLNTATTSQVYPYDVKCLISPGGWDNKLRFSHVPEFSSEGLRSRNTLRLCTPPITAPTRALAPALAVSWLRNWAGGGGRKGAESKA